MLAAHVLGERYQRLATDADALPVRADVEPPPEHEVVWQHLAETTGFHQENDGFALPGDDDKVLWAVIHGRVLGTIGAAELASSMEQASEDC